MNRNITKRVIAALVLVSFACFALTGCLGNSKEKERRVMEKHLEETYDREFVVEKPYSTGFPWGGGYTFADAYPKDEPELRFTIQPDEGGTYRVGYLQALWGIQLKKELEPEVKEMYGKDAKVECSVNYNIESTDFDEFKKMSFNELAKKYEGQGLLSCEITVTFYSERCLFDTDPEAETKKVMWFKENHYLKFKNDTFWEYYLILNDLNKKTQQVICSIVFNDNTVFEETEFRDMTMQSILEELKNDNK